MVADVVHADVAALHLHDHLLGLAALVVEKVDVAVYAGVCALLVVLGGPRAHYDSLMSGFASPRIGFPDLAGLASGPNLFGFLFKDLQACKVFLARCFLMP